MSRNSKVLMLDENTYNRMAGRHTPMICIRCGKPLKLGEVVVTRSRHTRDDGIKTRRYHRDCWEGTFLG